MRQGITTNKIDDSKEIPRVQVEFDGNTVDNMVLIEPKGEHSIPPKGTNCLVLQVSENQYFILPNDNKNRPKDLKDTEKATGNFEAGCMIKYRNNGDIEIFNKQGASVTLNSSGEVVVNAGSNNAVQYQAMNTFIQSFVSQVNAELQKIDTAVPAYTTTPIIVDTSTSKITKFKVE